MFQNKKFRAVLSSILVVSTLVYTTPLYAASSTGAGPKRGPAVQRSNSASSQALKAPASMSSGGMSQGWTDFQNFGISAAQAPSTNLMTGAAVHSIPIEVPKGPGDIAPKLSLIYSSQQGNGWLGVGWSLDMGAIQRSTKNGLNYAGNDFIALANGSSSELVSRSSDWEPNTYGNKIEGAFLKYSLSSPTAGWTVTDKSGTKYFYGRSSDSRQENSHGVFKWLLDRVEDINGNAMTVSYTKDAGGEVYLASIAYNGNYVDFISEGRTDSTLSFTSHAQVRTNAKRLKSIVVYGNGHDAEHLARVYDLSYTYSPNTGRSRLSTITQKGSDGSTALPPISFTYQTSSTLMGTAAQTDYPRGRRNPNSNMALPFQMTDLNGDGKADFIYDENGGAVSANIHILYSAGGTLGGDTVKGFRTNRYFPYTTFGLGDVDGDGNPDFVYLDYDFWIHVLAGTRSGFGGDQPKKGHALDFRDRTKSTFKIADVNGDGRSDYIYEAANGFHILFGTATGTFTSDQSNASGVRTANYNPNMQDFRMGDVNGDGKADIVYDDGSNNIHVLLSTGSGFGQDQTWRTKSYQYLDGTKFQLSDLNGDGLADFIYNCYGPSGLEFRVLLSTGSSTGGFVSDTRWGLQGSYYIWNCIDDDCEWANLMNQFYLADVNSDGLPDLIYSGVTSYLYSAEYTGIRVLINNGSSFGPDTFVAWQLSDFRKQNMNFAIADANGDGFADILYDGWDSYLIGSVNGVIRNHNCPVICS